MTVPADGALDDVERVEEPGGIVAVPGDGEIAVAPPDAPGRPAGKVDRGAHDAGRGVSAGRRQ